MATSAANPGSPAKDSRHTRCIPCCAPLRSREFSRYAASVPDDFRFLVKAWEGLLLERFPRHSRYGASAGEANPHFLDPACATDVMIAPACEGLGAKLGTMLFQFTPERRGLFADPPAFAARLRASSQPCLEAFSTPSSCAPAP